jgi:hypothetical protein
MEKIFLSYHYDDGPNRELARQVEELLETHAVLVVTGEALGGGSLTPEIKKEIEGADALVALLTRNQEVPATGKWTTHPWCAGELQYARDLAEPRPAIALVEEGVDVSGLYKEHEYIRYDADRPLPAFLKLSKTLFRWRKRFGRTLKIQLLPEHVARDHWAQRNACQWEYRLTSGMQETEWRRGRPQDEPGGLFLYVRVPDDTMMIEVRIVRQGKAWGSKTASFYMPVSLVEEGGAQ